MSIPVWPVTGACCQSCAGGAAHQHGAQQRKPAQYIEVECFCQKGHKKKHHGHAKKHCDSLSSSSSSSSCSATIYDMSSSSSSCEPIVYKKHGHKKAHDCDKKKHHHHHDKGRCGNKVEIEIVIPQAADARPAPCFPSSARACGCSALASQLLALVSTPVPTAAAIALVVANATAYVACRTASGSGFAPDVIALNALLTFLATLTPGTFPATAQALALQAYQRLIEVCAGCSPCGQRPLPY
jgi:hypothetical protein